MKTRSICFACAVYLCLLLANEACAYSNVSTASGWCYDLVKYGNGAFIEPLVDCFTDTSKGIIPSVTSSFITNTEAYYMTAISVMFLLVIAWFGYRTTVGDVRRLKAETAILGLKMAGVMLFLGQANALYLDLVNIIQYFSQSIVATVSSLHSGGFCTASVSAPGSGGNWTGSGDTSVWQNTLWTQWDCIFGYILGLSAYGFAATSMASFLIMMAFSMGTGLLVMFVGIYLILALLIAAFKFVHVYLMSMLALSFMFCIGYMFVPLILFRQTAKYFKTWLTLVFGYMLTPIIMFAFMGMMLVAIDITVFTGKYSIYCIIGGPAKCGSGHASAGAGLFSGITGNLTPWDQNPADAATLELSGYALPGTNFYIQNSFWNIFYAALNGTRSITTVGDPSGTGILPVEYADESSMPSLQNLTRSSGAGMLGPRLSTVNCNAALVGSSCSGGTLRGSNFASDLHPYLSQVGAPLLSLNLSAVASAAGGTCNAGVPLGTGDTTLLGNLTDQASLFFNNCPWVDNLLIAFCVAGLIAYIMISLLTFIPTLASNLTQDLIKGDFISQGAASIKSALFGDGSIMNAAKGGVGGAGGDSGGGLLASARSGLESLIARR